MIGNQIIINRHVKEHEKNPIKDTIGEVSADHIIYIITDEYWKEWRRKLTNSEKPYIYAPGIGYYKLMYGKSKQYLRKILARLKRIKTKYPDAYLKEGNPYSGMYLSAIKRFRCTWKQVDQLRLETNYKNALWRQKKIDKYGDKAIL